MRITLFLPNFLDIWGYIISVRGYFNGIKWVYKFLIFKILFQIWLPDVEVLNLKIFHALNVLDKLQGLWVSQNSEVLYVLATRITFICAMTFEAFPLDVQTCLFQVSCTINHGWGIDRKETYFLTSEIGIPQFFYF